MDNTKPLEPSANRPTRLLIGIAVAGIALGFVSGCYAGRLFHPTLAGSYLVGNQQGTLAIVLVPPTEVFAPISGADASTRSAHAQRLISAGLAAVDAFDRRVGEWQSSIDHRGSIWIIRGHFASTTPDSAPGSGIVFRIDSVSLGNGEDIDGLGPLAFTAAGMARDKIDAAIKRVPPPTEPTPDPGSKPASPGSTRRTGETGPGERPISPA